jgi:uncharacterized phage protein (TIGR02216 family)
VADESPAPEPLTPDPSPTGEGKSFTESAANLAGLAGALLGWRPDEFWRATPAELAAVLAAMLSPEAQSVSAEDLARLMERFPDG